VLEAFRPRVEGKPICRHLNGIAWDNTINNLEWGTSIENHLDAVAHGTLSKRGGRQAKLTPAMVDRIRSESKGHIDDLRLAHALGVSRELVRDVRMGLRWAPEDFIVGKRAKFMVARVVSVAVGPPEVTYGLEVEADHSHITGGVVTHNSGRYACRLQSCPRWSPAIEDRPRELYTASAGGRLVYFDLSQAEMRAAAFLSGDPVFQETCRGDVHAGNAKVLFPSAVDVLTRDPKGAGKPFRDIAKNAGFAVSYMAEAPTVFAYLRAHGFPVSLDDVDAMLDRLRSAYRVYYDYVRDNVAFVEREGYLRTALTGRIRRFGYHPKAPDIANFPIQSLVADVMNIRSLGLGGRLPWGARIVAQIHDALLIDVRVKDVERVVSFIKETWAAPVVVSPSQVCPAGAEFLLPAEIKVGRRWSSF
jgi:hypothetical protein